MEEIGQVIDISGDKVSVEIKETIGACSSCSSCSSALTLSSSDEKETRIIKIFNSIGAGTGDFVVLELKESVSIFISILLYIFPILMMLAGYFFGEYLAYDFRAGRLEDDVLAIVFSFLFLFLGFVIVYFLDKLLSRKKSFSPQLKSFYRFNL